MTRIRSYRRPPSLDDALALLARPGIATAPLGRGTALNAAPDGASEEVVDLQALGLDVDLVLRNGDLLGRLLDTFVAAQLRAELASSASRPRLYHVRQQQGRFEVDLLR
jgi:hypothetical protein